MAGPLGRRLKGIRHWRDLRRVVSTCVPCLLPSSEFCSTTQHLLGGGGLIPAPPLLSDWGNFLRAFGQSKVFCSVFGASQFRPKQLFGAFGASNNSGSPEGGGGVPPSDPPPP